MFTVILLQVVWGISLPLNKFLMTMCSPLYFVGVRMLLSGTLLLSGAFLFYRKKFVFDSRHLGLYLQLAFFGIYFKYMLRNWSLNQMTAVKMGFLLSSAPFFSALFSFYFFGQVHTKKQWLGLIIGLAGLIPVLILKSPTELLSQQFFSLSLPELIAFIAVLSHVYAMVLVKKLRKAEVSSVMINGFKMVVGGGAALVTGIIFEGWFPVSNPPVFAKWLLALIFVSNFLCHTLYVKLLKKYTVTFLSFTDFLDPIMIAFYSKIFLKESISWHYYLAAPIIFVGIYLFYQDELQVIEVKSASVFSLKTAM